MSASTLLRHRWLAISRGRYHPELLHQAQMVLLPPVLGALPALDAGYKDARKTDPPSCSSEAHQLAGVVCFVDVAHRHLVALREDILDAHVHVQAAQLLRKHGQLPEGWDKP